MKNWQAIGFSLALAACSSAPKPQTASSPPSPPDITKALPAIKSVIGQMNLTGPLLLAGPFATSTKLDPPHYFCLKSTAETRFMVVLFFKGDKYDSARTATAVDHCDGAPYQALPD